MKLSALAGAVKQNKVFIFQTSSSMLDVFVTDIVKSSLYSSRDFQRELNDKKGLKDIREIYNVEPFGASKWLVIVSLEKFSRNFKDLISLINESTTTFFFCKSEGYRTYKAFKDALSKAHIDQVCDSYVMYMRTQDFHFVYSSIVPEEYRMSKQLTDFVCQSYGSDIEAEMELFEYLKSGETVKTRKDIAEICGIGGNSVDSFVISLLKDPPKTAKGATTVIRNRMKAGDDLAQVYGYRTFKAYIQNCVKCLIDVKMLVLSGAIYKHIARLPNGYDEKKLGRYQRYFWTLKKIPLSRIVRLQVCIQRVNWSSDLALANLIYGYYKDLIQHEVVPYLPKTTVFDRYVEEKKKEDARIEQMDAEAAEERKRRKLALIQQHGLVKGKKLFAKEQERYASSVNADVETVSDADFAVSLFRKLYGIKG